MSAMMEHLNIMDDGTLALILQLQIDDSLELEASVIGKGKGRVDHVSDLQLALQLYAENLERNSIIVADRQMTKSIAHACQTDGAALTAVLSRDHDCAGDREMAWRLSGIATTAPAELRTVSSKFLDRQTLEKLEALSVASPQDVVSGSSSKTLNADEEDVPNQPEGSNWAMFRETKATYKKCISCQEDVRSFDVTRLPCRDEYCRDCLQGLFQGAMQDETLFPPRCCKQPIVPSQVREFLTPDLIQRYEAKKIERDTLDRTYCADCSTFIPTVNAADERVQCPECEEVTCTICKGRAHIGDCPADKTLQEFLTLAEAQGWRRCNGCKSVVELAVGCNHITCRCGSQFCYVCGEKWKTCRCEQWDEERLIVRARQVVAREPALRDPQVRNAAVAQNLRTRHNCEHTNWAYVRGEHRCEECQDTLPSFIFECMQCSIRACKRCRHNRL